MFRDGYAWFSVIEPPHVLRWHAAKLNGLKAKCGGAPAPRNRYGLEVPGERGEVCFTCLQALRAIPERG